MTDKFAAFDSAVTAAMAAASQPGDPTLVSRITNVDSFFVIVPLDADDSLREPLQERMNSTLTILLQHPDQLERFAFAATLGTGGQGPYFAKLMAICREQAETLQVKELLTVIGSLRRAKQYADMDVCIGYFNLKLAGDESQPASALRSKKSYDQSMAAEQQAKAALSPTDATRFYQESLRFAEQSANEAMKGGDPVGRLYALTISSGLVLPELGRWKESITTSTEISRDARSIYASMPAGDARTRVERIDMNATFHRINITVKHDGNADDIPGWLGELEAIPIYDDSCRTQDWAIGYVATAKSYITSKKPS